MEQPIYFATQLLASSRPVGKGRVGDGPNLPTASGCANSPPIRNFADQREPDGRANEFHDQGHRDGMSVAANHLHVEARKALWLVAS